jgi:hypothetical protein
MPQDRTASPELMIDTVCLHKPDGRVFKNIKACVSTGASGRGGILIEDRRLPIEAGDRFTRRLPRGLTEEFLVDGARYCEQVSGIPAHYQVSVHQPAAPPRAATVAASGAATRVRRLGRHAKTLAAGLSR